MQFDNNPTYFNSKEIIRLRKQNLGLFEKLKKFSSHINGKLIRLPHKKSNEKRPELKEIALTQEANCLDKEESVFKKEIESLKSRLRVNTSYERVTELQKQLASSLLRNDAINKSIKEKSKEMEKRGKTISKMQREPKSTAQTDVEFNRLAKFLENEIKREAELTARLKQTEDNIACKENTIEELKIKVNHISEEIKEFQQQQIVPKEEIVQIPTEIIDNHQQMEILKTEYTQLKTIANAEQKCYKREISELQEQVMLAKTKLREQTTVFDNLLQYVR